MDYAALAKQNGGTTVAAPTAAPASVAPTATAVPAPAAGAPTVTSTLAPVDYAALAKTAGGEVLTPSTPNYFQRVGADIKGGFQGALEAEKSSGQGQTNPLLAGLTIAKNLTSAAVSPITEAVVPVISPVLDPIVKAITNTKTVQAFTDFMSKYPDAAGAISDALQTGLNVATIDGGIEAAPKIVSGVKTVVSSVSGGISSALDTAAETAKNVVKTGTNKLGIQNPLQVLTPAEQAIKDTTPSYNKNLLGEPTITNPDGTIVPRVSEAKGIAQRTVNPTNSETAAGIELAKTPSYNPAATNLEKLNAVKPEIVTEAQNIEAGLQNENILRPPKEVFKIIKTAVDNASQDSLLLQKTDPVVQNYLRVANRAIADQDGTLLGEFRIRKVLDQAYENAGGKYVGNKGLDQIHTAARNALTKDVASKAQNTDVIASLQKQTNLYRAADVLETKAASEGATRLAQVIKQYPMLSKILKTAIGYLGLGEVINLVEH